MAIIVKQYVPENNPDGACLPGMPLSDLTDEVYDAQPDWLKQSIDGCGFYVDYVEPEAPEETQEVPGEQAEVEGIPEGLQVEGSDLPPAKSKKSKEK